MSRWLFTLIIPKCYNQWQPEYSHITTKERWLFIIWYMFTHELVKDNTQSKVNYQYPEGVIT
ncbi:hypothetical protein CMT48_17190 [Elizabethkingia anophelis]|nr:hypothetical protein [Elizabethkingia anophelis]